MKRKYLLILTVFLAFGCQENKSGSSVLEEANLGKEASYALGMNIGASLIEDMVYNGIYPTIDDFVQGIKDSVTGAKLRYDVGEARQLLEEAFNAIMEVRTSEAVMLENQFLAENSKKPGVMITASGLQYEIIYETNELKPEFQSMVRVNYEGKFIDGTLFDSSYVRGEPAEFQLNEVITGWAEGLQLMGIGSIYKFYIPSSLGYGAFGQGAVPPYATLIFEV
jgi:FKBP-type peptidyl-prolyl cis-trans isomerase